MTKATFEVVFFGAPDSLLPRVFQVGVGDSEGVVALANSMDGILLRIGGNTIATWSYPTARRHVLHVRIDLMNATAASRAELFADGVLVPTTVFADAGLVIPQIDNQPFVLGNRESANRSLGGGTIYYCALYTAWLTEDEIATNAAILLASDDTPIP
jgi:hypothetical protein